MTQKNKVKELVGRGLNSYHTKALQQMDRIEKKNKEQNHKISILSNELDNDYLTKTEEGSVISLEHSKEGMVYLDELQGNTLVNYCTDGFKELTLNGDIDVEGTFVTTTEGVDNGLVDVACEGNTLVNLNKRFNSTQTPSWDATNSDYVVSVEGHTVAGGVLWYYTYLKPSTTYTMVVNILECANMGDILLDAHYSYPPANIITLKKEVGVQKIVFNTKDSFEQVGPSIKIATYGKDTTNKLKISKHMLLLEGDWTDKEIPPYFEGMKSVGECEDNKIEILSQNKNLYSYETMLKDVQYITKLSDTSIKVERTNPPSYSYYGRNISEHLINGKTYSLRADVSNIELGTYGIDIVRKSDNYREQTNALNFVADTNKYIYTLKFYCNKNATAQTGLCSVTYTNIQLEYGNSSTSVVSPKLNKKEILINEPLRKLPNGVCDKVVKIGNKHFIERNCGELTLDNNSTVSVPPNGSNWYKLSASGGLKVNTLTFSIPKPSNCANTWGNGTNNNMAISDKFIIYPSTDASAFYDGEKIVFDNSDFKIGINKTKLTSQDIDGFKQWLQSNPVKVVYQLKTPIYEPLEIEPTLLTYNDVTHISNNSIIPCNMKIQNSGYNAIIKPSTLYTIALDTNKSGTIGMNLGGAKATTTNNIATITTPATLADDSLRIYGKGIKGSKVRLLEGDKTNWIPSHFEGMQSSFEDKLQDDGTYKMEILSNNKNLLDVEENLTFDTKTILVNLKKGRYTVSFKSISGHLNGAEFTIAMYYGNKEITYITVKNRRTFNLDFDCDRIHLYSYGYNWAGSQGKLITVNTLQITKGDTVLDAELQKSNKIQFSSIEPLRGVDDVKDRFVFKDGKLMIERNCGTGSLDGTASIYHCWTNNRNDIVSGYIYYYEHKPEITNIKQYSNVVCTDLPNNRGGHISTEEGFRNTAYFAFSIHKSKLGIEDINAEEVNQNILKRYFTEHPLNFVYQLAEPTYEEIPFELQKIILEGYENGTLFIDTNIPPTVTTTYAGETPIAKSVKLNKTEVLNNTNDINDNIIPYLMDMDYRVVCLQLQSEGFNGGVAMARLFGGAYEMLQRDIQSKRYSIDEYKHRLDAYLDANKITEEEYNKLGDMLNE